ILVRSRAPCNGRPQTPPGPEGSNGSGAVRVPRITRGLAYAHPMYQVIARKYRPQTFHDVVNQEHVKTTLENAIAQNRRTEPIPMIAPVIVCVVDTGMPPSEAHPITVAI